MSNDMRESYLALKKIAKESFFLPLRESAKRLMRENREIVAKYDQPATGPSEPVGPTVKDEMRESYFAIKKVADDVIGKPARVAREMIATQTVDMKSAYARVDAETRTGGLRQNGDDKPLAGGGASGAAP
jgi:hypothetical protein